MGPLKALWGEVLTFYQLYPIDSHTTIMNWYILSKKGGSFVVPLQKIRVFIFFRKIKKPILLGVEVTLCPNAF